MNDDPYPNDGSTFYSPPEDDLNKQVVEVEKLEAIQAAPFLDQTLQWFEDQMEACDSISFALDVSDKYLIPTEQAMTALNIVRLLLADKKMEFDNLKTQLTQK